MDSSLTEPFHLLMRYAAIVVPVATAVPALIAQFHATSRARHVVLLLWLAAPATLALVAFECGRLCVTYCTLPQPFFLLLLATSVLMGLAYIALAPSLLDYFQLRIVQHDTNKIRQKQRDFVTGELARLLGYDAAEPMAARRCIALLRRIARSLSLTD